MKILFTKKLDDQAIGTVLGSKFECSFEEVIQPNVLKTNPFPLQNRSLIFTSVNGVDACFKNGFRPSDNFTEKNFNKIYCVGKKTKIELRKHGLGVFKLKKNARELSEFIIANCAKEKFIHFCGDLSLDILQRKLPLQNIDYKKIVVYKTKLLYPTFKNNYDAIVFFSPSGVRSFVKNNSLSNKYIFSIGETTAAEIANHTTQKVHFAHDNDLSGLLKLIKNEAL